jgi:hypothetical protein
MLWLSKLARTAVLGLFVAALPLPGQAAELDRLAPGDTEAALVVNIKNALDSQLFKKFGEAAVRLILLDGNIRKYLEATGLDPFKDLGSCTMTYSGGKDPRFAVIVKGNFNVGKLQDTIEAEGKKVGEKFKSTKVGELTFYTLGGARGEVTGTFLGKDTLALSNNLDYLKQIVAGKKIEATAPARAFQGALGKVPGQETFLLGFAITDEMKQVLNDPRFPQLKLFAEKTEALTATINVAAAVDITLGVTTIDEESARSLGKFIKDRVVPLARLAVADNEKYKPLGDAASALKIAAEGKVLSLQLHLTEDQLKALVELALTFAPLGG